MRRQKPFLPSVTAAPFPLCTPALFSFGPESYLQGQINNALRYITTQIQIYTFSDFRMSV
uniref:Uncharacterized protein n=1 Tax=Anguilla anguilla TaxID=7936 RepID=A0A0E9SFP3_ANGAN